jgi:hypothetical protein
VNVVLQKRPGKRSGNRREAFDDEIDVVQVAWLDRSSVCSKLCVNGQAARQRTWKAVSENRGYNLRGPTRIMQVQQSPEHAS